MWTPTPPRHGSMTEEYMVIAQQCLEPLWLLAENGPVGLARKVRLLEEERKRTAREQALARAKTNRAVALLTVETRRSHELAKRCEEIGHNVRLLLQPVLELAPRPQTSCSPFSASASRYLVRACRSNLKKYPAEANEEGSTDICAQEGSD